MSADATPRPGFPRIYLALLVVAAVVVLWVVGGSLFGPRKPRPERPSSSTADPTSETSVATVAELLRRSSDLEACRQAVQLLNDLNRNRPNKPTPPTPEERKRWGTALDLDPDELDEVSSTDFTPLDAFHLEQCFLLRDAAHGLLLDGLPDRDRAAAAFAWVVREVRLQTDQTDLLPPLLVLRRGWGNAEERALVFLELLRQLHLPGCLVAVPAKDGVRPWLPAVLLDGELYLFDARLGAPIPGPRGEGVATLAQVRDQPELLRALAIDADHPYDVTAEQASRAELWIACPLSFASPRMQALQEALGPTVHLADDPTALAAALKSGATVVRAWTAPTTPNVPTRTLRTTLPPEDGRPSRFSDRYLKLFSHRLVPPNAYPAAFKKIPVQVQRLSQQFELIFAQSFADLYLTTPPRTPPPRDLMLRGRCTEALPKLVAMADQTRELVERAQANPDLKANVEKWIQELQTAAVAVREAEKVVQQTPTAAAQEQLAQARQALAVSASRARWGAEVQGAALVAQEAEKEAQQTPSAETRAKFDQARQALDEATSRRDEPELLLRTAAGEAQVQLASYMLALCKQEQAEVAQLSLDHTPNAPAAEVAVVKDAWVAADDAWRDYLNRAPTDEVTAAATLNRARVLERLGQREAAAALLSNPPKLSGWNATAWLYRARELRR